MKKLLNKINRITRLFRQINHIEMKISEIERKIDNISTSEEGIKNNVSKAIVDNWAFFNSIVDYNLEAQFNNMYLKREEIKDKPLFLIGNGPSLKDIDVSILKDCYTMCFNRAYIAFKDWGFEPTYFAALDFHVNENNAKEFKRLINKSKIERFFFYRNPFSIENFVSPKTSLVQIGSNDNPNLDFNRKLNSSNTGLFGLQVALGLLGFREVYLLGCDATYVENVTGVVAEGKKYTSLKDNDPNHFRPDYFGKGTVYTKPCAYKFHYLAWKAFYEREIKNNMSGYKVYNCSKNGKLTFFKYKDFKDIAKDIEKYKK